MLKTNYLSELQLFVAFDQSEAATGCVLQKKKLFLKIPQYSTESTCVGVFKNTYFEEDLQMTASVSVPWDSYIDSFFGSIAHILIFKLLSSFLQMFLNLSYFENSSCLALLTN